MDYHQLLKSDFLYITHGTQIDNIESIIRDGHLKTLAPEYNKILIKNRQDYTNQLNGGDLSDTRPFDQYTGVYTTLWQSHEITEWRRYMSRVNMDGLFGNIAIFVFPIDLMLRLAWHANLTEYYGIFKYDTCTYLDILKRSRGKSVQEMIYHYPIDINQAVCIIADEEDIAEINEMLKQYNRPIKCITSQEFNVKRYLGNLPATPQTPIFFYDNFGGCTNDPAIIYEHQILLMLRNAGISDEIYYQHGVNYAIMMIRRKYVEVILGEKSPDPPVHFPPFPENGVCYIQNRDDNLLYPT